MKLSCTFALLLPLLASTALAREPLRIGVAEADITPPLRFPMAGYYHERLATGTHDPLKAKAIVWRGAGAEAALVVCDLTGVAADLSAEVRRRASAETGIPPSHIVVSATHSHTAPDYTKDLYGYFGKDGGAARHPYSDKLVAGIVRAIREAHARARPAVVDAGSARQQVPVSFNRRFVMKDGSVRTWMRLDQPGVLRAAGPIDPEVGVAVFRAADDPQPLGVLSNFALHLDTVGGTLWSADYPYYIEQTLRRTRGKDVISVFGTGCCGDINHVDPVSKDRNKTDFIGNELAHTVVGALPRLRGVKDPTLRVRTATVPLPLQPVTAADVARARPLILEARAGKQVDFYDLVRAYKAVMLDQLEHRAPATSAPNVINWGLTHTWAGVGDRLPVEVTAICLGDELAVVCLPGEIFVELGLAIKHASPFRTTLIVELSNCVETVYVPTRAAYAGGGYEVANAACQAGSGEMLVEAAVRLLREAATAEAQAQAAGRKDE